MKSRLFSSKKLADRAHYRLIALFGLRASTLINLGNGEFELRVNVTLIRCLNAVHD